MTELEKKVMEVLEAELIAMLEKFDSKQFMKKCKLMHLSEMVKLCHQMRSLKAKDEEGSVGSKR